MISMACFTILTAINFFPLFRPCIMSELVSLQQAKRTHTQLNLTRGGRCACLLAHKVPQTTTTQTIQL